MWLIDKNYPPSMKDENRGLYVEVEPLRYGLSFVVVSVELPIIKFFAYSREDIVNDEKLLIWDVFWEDGLEDNVLKRRSMISEILKVFKAYYGSPDSGEDGFKDIIVIFDANPPEGI